MISDILKLTLWFVLTASIGWSILSVISCRKALLCPAEKMALSYPLGLGMVTVEMAVLSWLGLKFSAFSILIWWLPISLTAFFITGARKDIIKEKQHLSLLEKFFISGISGETIYAFFKALIKPIESYDAVAIYAMKAKIFFIAKAIPRDFFKAFKGVVPHIEYPLGLPLSETWFYTFFGDLNDLLVKAIFPLYYLAALAVFYFVLRRFAERKTALLFTFLLATVPQFNEYAANGYADLPLAFYYSASFLYLMLWMRKNELVFLALSFIFSILGVWTKTEGLMLFCVNLATAMIYLLGGKKVTLKGGVSYLIVSSLAIAIYLHMRKTMALGIHGDLAGLTGFDAARLMASVKRIPPILYEYQRQFFGPKKWNIVWMIFIIGFIMKMKKAFSGEMRIITLSIIFTFCGYALVYMSLPQDISWHLSTTASRFFIHFLPIVVFWIALLFREVGLDI